MAEICRDYGDLVGHTPLFALDRYAKACGLTVNLYAKLEWYGPTGSAMDRAAVRLLSDARADGSLRPGATVIVPTAGNLGVALAAFALRMGYHCFFVMPADVPLSQQRAVQFYGANLYRTAADLGLAGAVKQAGELQAQIPGSYLLDPFDSESVSKAHFLTTGPEIWEDTKGEVDIFVAGVGTGGTITGVGEYLKRQNLGIQVIAVEPAASPVLSGGYPGQHRIPELGAGFIPASLNDGIFNEVLACTDWDAMDTVKRLAATEGLCCGPSSGAVLWAATQVMKRPENRTRMTVVLFPDGGPGVLSTMPIERNAMK